MTTKKYAITKHNDMLLLFAKIKEMQLPIVVAIRDGNDRTAAQNRLLHRWFADIATWRGDCSADEVKAECNLMYGRPILARDDEEWGAAFGDIFDSLSYPAKIKAIRALDVPFTRQMGIKQLCEYMDNMERDYRSNGVPLTDPEMMKYGE